MQETSLEAYEHVRHDESWTARVFELLKIRGGLTADEIVAICGVTHNTTSPRLTLLQRRGLIRDSGERRVTRAGYRAIVWEVVDAHL